jgi:hypothetical protein
LIFALLLAYAIPLGDVTVNSMAMAKVCPSAGLHIYKTVKVDGFVGHYNLKGSPYQFIEFPTLRANGTYYWARSERKPDGSISVQELAQPTSEYEVVDGQWHLDRSQRVEAKTELIRNRFSGEILAERNLYNPLPGWMDMILAIRWFGTGGRDGCHGAPSAGIDELKVLIPKHPNN